MRSCIYLLCLILLSLQLKAAPVLTVVENTSDQSQHILIHEGPMVERLTEFQKLNLSPKDQQKVSRALRRAIYQDLREELSPCFFKEITYKRLAKIADDAVILSESGLHQKMTRELKAVSSSCERSLITLADITELNEEPIWTIEDTFVDGLKYVASGVTQEKVILEFENGQKFKVVGNIFTITYQDLAQTSKDGESYAGAFSEDGFDLSLVYEINPNLELSSTAYLYQYGESSFNADKGKEIFFKLTYKVKDYFKVGVSYHIGKLGDGPDNTYSIGRIIGVYVPKAWR